MVTLFNQIAEVKLSYIPAKDVDKNPIVSNSRQVFEVFYNFWDLSQIAYRESFKVMLLNRANKVIGIMNVSEGGQAGTVADPKMILQSAILSHAASLILCHNHPSGNLTPSEADRKLTRKIKEGAAFLDLPVLDHLIIGTDGKYYSFADEGTL
ncbi:MAG: DNA repair protein [Bacteroidetes bacterium]|nr:MAG: DNA repair protein [Bacteroidota bacterium]